LRDHGPFAGPPPSPDGGCSNHTPTSHTEAIDTTLALFSEVATYLAFTGFPVSHWKKIWSTNPLSVNRFSGDTLTLAA